jgi:hypothetical protein
MTGRATPKWLVRQRVCRCGAGTPKVRREKTRLKRQSFGDLVNLGRAGDWTPLFEINSSGRRVIRDTAAGADAGARCDAPRGQPAKLRVIYTARSCTIHGDRDSDGTDGEGDCANRDASAS